MKRTSEKINEKQSENLKSFRLLKKGEKYDRQKKFTPKKQRKPMKRGTKTILVLLAIFMILLAVILYMGFSGRIFDTMPN